MSSRQSPASLSPPPETGSFARRAGAAWQHDNRPLTIVRRTVCEVIAAQSEPFTADDLLIAVRQVKRGISVASIYRTLGDLVAFGLLQQSPTASTGFRYVVTSAPACLRPEDQRS